MKYLLCCVAIAGFAAVMSMMKISSMESREEERELEEKKSNL